MKRRPKSKSQRGLVSLEIEYLDSVAPQKKQTLKHDVRASLEVDERFAAAIVACHTLVPLERVRILRIT